MYIKEVTIDGFKSYAQRVVVPEFDRYFNAITVRRRGEGEGRERGGGEQRVRACGVRSLLLSRRLPLTPPALTLSLSTQGLNGTGKSNILDAIVFVLGISNLSQVMRRERGGEQRRRRC